MGAGAYKLATTLSLMLSGVAWAYAGVWVHSDLTNFDAGQAEGYGTFAYALGWLAVTAVLALLAPVSYLILRSRGKARVTSHLLTQGLLGILCALGIAATLLP